MSDHKKTLNFTEFCDSFRAPLYQIEGNDFKCPPGYKYNKEQKQCVPKTPKDDVRKNKGDQDSRPGNGPNYNVWGSTGVNGDGYAWAEPNNWGGGGSGSPEAVPYSEEYLDVSHVKKRGEQKK